MRDRKRLADFVVFILLFLAIAIGWLLGRTGAGGGPARIAPPVPLPYRGEPDEFPYDTGDGAIDAFINGLEVNSDTVETHIALGSQLRRRGEVERAVRVHRNLLEAPLPRARLDQAQLELARDYISAGLLDRAEELLLKLVQGSSGHRQDAQRHLLEIYETERDWQRATDTARELLAGSRPTGPAPPGPPVEMRLAHYHCELAAEASQRGDHDRARGLLQEALRQDPRGPRASILLGEVEYLAGNYRAALASLQQVAGQDPDFIPETLDCLGKCYRALGDEQGLRDWLFDCLKRRGSAPLVVAVTDHLAAAEGETAARDFLGRCLPENPSLPGLSRLIELQLAGSAGEARAQLAQLRDLVGRLQSRRPTYRCAHCGFTGHNLHWHCPGCKHWGSIKAAGDTGVQ